MLWVLKGCNGTHFRIRTVPYKGLVLITALLVTLFTMFLGLEVVGVPLFGRLVQNNKCPQPKRRIITCIMDAEASTTDCNIAARMIKWGLRLNPTPLFESLRHYDPKLLNPKPFVSKCVTLTHNGTPDDGIGIQ